MAGSGVQAAAKSIRVPAQSWRASAASAWRQLPRVRHSDLTEHREFFAPGWTQRGQRNATDFRLSSTHACKLGLDRVQAQGFAVPLRSFARLAQDEEPERAGREARGGGRLG